MKSSFFIARPDAKGKTSIYATLSIGGKKFKYYIGEKIEPINWNPTTKSARQSSRFPQFPEFNQRLRNIQTTIDTTLLSYKNQTGLTPSIETFRKLLDKEIKKIEPIEKKQVDLFSFFKEFIEISRSGLRENQKTNKPIRANTIKKYVTTLGHLTQFQKTYKRPIDFNTIDLDFYEDFKKYLVKDKLLASNSIGKYFQTLKLVLGEANERGINSNLFFRSKRFKVLREKSDSIYLTENEIKDIEQLDLSKNKRLESVRDLFLIGCYTGLRYSDCSKLNSEQIKNGFIEIKAQVKTSIAIDIPIDHRTEKIIRKYGGEFPKSISNQKTNDYLKEICRKVDSLNKKVSLTITKGGFVVNQVFDKWEVISTHTARRSFATNEYNQGTPVLEIMAITGHRTETAFLEYIKKTQKDHAISFKKRLEERRMKGLLKAS